MTVHMSESLAPLALGVDIGTTNIKVVVLESSGADIEVPRVLGSASIGLETTHDGPAVTQDGNEIWDGVCSAIRKALQQATDLTNQSDLPQRVATVGICSQYSSIVAINESAEPVAPVITYMDHRGTDECFNILTTHDDAFELWLQRHGIPPVGAGLSLSHILYTQLYEPDVHARTHVYVEVMDYITARLTGTISASIATMFAAQLCNNQLHLDPDFATNPVYDNDLIARSGVDPTKLAPLVPVDQPAGTLTTQAADLLGLPEQVIVATPMNDTHAGAYATGAFHDDVGGVMIGTTAVFIDTVDQVGTDIDHELVAMPAPEPGKYLIMAENGIAGRAVEHVLSNLLAPPAEATTEPVDPFGELDVALTASPPGANGLMFLPWIAGSMAPRADGAMRGGFLGLSVTTTRSDMIRAVIEGTIHNLAWLMGPVAAHTGHQAKELVFGGGAARSDQWAQIAADIVNTDVSVMERPDIAAARAVGTVALARFLQVQPGTVPLSNRFTPRPEFAARYQELHDIFASAYEATHPLMTKLSNIAASPLTP